MVENIRSKPCLESQHPPGISQSHYHSAQVNPGDFTCRLVQTGAVSSDIHPAMHYLSWRGQMGSGVLLQEGQHHSREEERDSKQSREPFLPCRASVRDNVG